MDYNLPELIKQAFLSSSNEARAHAEQALQQAMAQNLDVFLLHCASLLAEDSQDTMVRSGAATLIKNVSSKLPSSQGISEAIKGNLLKALITKDKNIKRLAANAVASLAVHEFQRQSWQELIPSLAINLTHTDVEVKKAAIMTLGFICEALKDKQLESFLEASKIEEILKGILLGLKKDETDSEVTLVIQVKSLAVQALQASLGFMRAQYEKKEIRDYMLDCLVTLCNDQHKALKVQALQCMMDVAKALYSYLSEYIHIFYQILAPLCVVADQEISVPAIEFWTSVAQEDSDRGLQNKPNAQIRLCHENLVKVLLQNLVSPSQQSEDEEGEVSTKDSSYKCLLMICEVVGEAVLANFLPFISNTINSDQPLNRQASMMAFSSMLDGPADHTLAPMIQSAFPKVITLLQDPSQDVVKWTSVSIQRIAEHHAMCILDQLDTALPVFLNSLQKSAKVAINICWIFFYLSEHLPTLQPNHSLFAQFEHIVETLIQLCSVANQNVMLIDVAFSTVIQMIKNSKNKAACTLYLEKFIQLFQQTAHIRDKEQRDTVKRGLCTGIHVCLYGLDTLQDLSIIQGLYNLIIEDFKRQQDIHDDGIAVIAALTFVAREKFTPFLAEFFPYLKAGLEKVTEKDVFKVSLDYISQVSKSCPQAFEAYVQEIVGPLLVCLNRQDFDNELKLSVFECLGDISLYYPDQIVNHLQHIMDIFKLALKAALQLQTSVPFQLQTDANQVDYADQLKDTLVQTFTCLLHAMNERPQSEFILQQVPDILEFFKRSTGNQLNPTVEYLRNVLALVSDIAQFFGDKVTAHIKQQFVQDIVDQLGKFQHIQENKEILQYAIKQISKLK